MNVVQLVEAGERRLLAGGCVDGPPGFAHAVADGQTDSSAGSCDEC